MSSPSRRIASMTSGSTARRSASHEPDRQSAYRSLVEGAIGVQPSARRAAERGLRTRGTEADSGNMRRLALVACGAGLAPTPLLGTEVVARMLGFRVNHLRDQEHLELQLSQPATRAEAAYSIARLLTIQNSEVDAVRSAVDSFTMPLLTPWQQ